MGGITVNFQLLELTLAEACWSQISADQRMGQAVTAQMSFRRIADLCGVLVDVRVADEELRSRAHDIISTRCGAADGARFELARRFPVHTLSRRGSLI